MTSVDRPLAQYLARGHRESMTREPARAVQMPRTVMADLLADLRELDTIRTTDGDRIARMQGALAATAVLIEELLAGQTAEVES